MKLKDTLLIVGKNSTVRSQLRQVFMDRYNIIEASTSEQGLLLFGQNISCIGAALLDMGVPKNKGKSLTARMRGMKGAELIPIIVLCDAEDEEMEIRAYEYGASDVIAKPFRETSIFHRVQNLVDLSIHKSNLEVLVEEQAEQLRSSNESMVDVLSSIIEYRNVETGNHVMRIRQYTHALLEKVMENCPEYHLTPKAIDSISSAASLHDIGKISIPDVILNKPGRLTEEEFEIMKTHTLNGTKIIQGLNEVSDREYLRYAYNICRYHHERWDGNGYPDGLSKDEIPICAQVAGVADAYDALTSDRVYKKAYSHGRAINMILNGECGAFSYKILDCLKKACDEFRAIQKGEDLPAASEASDILQPLAGPSYSMRKINDQHIMQTKYQTLLHHVNAAVVEAELNSGIYHIVFNPNPDFYLSGSKNTLKEALQDMIDITVHPDDREFVSELIDRCRQAFTERGVRKYTCQFRIYLASEGSYGTYEMNVLHVRDVNPEHITVMMIFEPARRSRKIETSEDTVPCRMDNSRFYNLLGSTLICENNRDISILSGAENLFALTGYTPEEIQQNFHNSLMEMILEEDRRDVAAQIDEQLAQGKMMELEYRIKTRAGHNVWILDKSRLEEQPDGREWIYRALLDNSKSKSVQQQLQAELMRNQLIINQSNDIIFELDIATDRLWCSDKWEERFGHKALQDEYTNKVYKYSHIHPDDLPKMREGISRLVSGEAHAQIDVRIVNAQGVYTWNQIRATSRRDSSGKVTKAIGVIVDIDKEMKSLKDLQQKSERDALTGLYNKEATQQHIKTLLEESRADCFSAFMIMDLDNFKSVNDTYGHLYGDNLLMETARKVRKYFRSDDIIGRVGGDEFVIFVRDFRSPELIYSRCSLFLEMLNDMLAEMVPDIAVSCSVGVAMVPEHGNSWMDLYHKADQALYQAKRAGKGCFVIYSDSTSQTAQNLISSINETIDSNEQPGIANNSLLYFLFQHLYESLNKYDAIQNILEEVGRRLNVSRVYIFESNDELTELSNTFEWCNEGIRPEIENLQKMNYIDGVVAGWPELFNERGIFYCADISRLEPGYRAVLEPQGIKSILHCGIYDSGIFRGLIGFDECSLNRNWTQDQIDLLVLLSQIVGLFLLRERDHDREKKE